MVCLEYNMITTVEPRRGDVKDELVSCEAVTMEHSTEGPASPLRPPIEVVINPGGFAPYLISRGSLAPEVCASVSVCHHLFTSTPPPKKHIQIHNPPHAAIREDLACTLLVLIV